MDQEREELRENECKSSLTKIIWDTKKAIKKLSVEEIKENILCSVYDNNSKLNQIVLKDEIQM